LLPCLPIVAEPVDDSRADSLTVEGQRFAIVPEWIIDAEIGDCAFRLYAVLLRYGQSSGVRMPSRATLARRLRKRSVDTVDRAMKELVVAGAVVVERRRDGKQNLTNRYHVRTSEPGRRNAATSVAGRTAAAGAGLNPAATPARKPAARTAASTRPDPEHVTQEQPPPPGKPDFAELATTCRELRSSLGLPVGMWTAVALEAAWTRAVVERGWPAPLAESACMAVAADPATRTPARVAEAGPWWEPPAASTTVAEDLSELEARLDALDGQRVDLQRRARAELVAGGMPLTRSTVVRRAALLLSDGAARPADAAVVVPA
jgi:hypothetical protein